MPPSFSIPWKTSQIFRETSSVRFSMYQEPPAGSTTLSRLHSPSRISGQLRAMRRENSSGMRTAASKGSTSMLSTPPIMAEKAWAEPRSRLTQGSTLERVQKEVRACRLILAASSLPPHSLTMRAQSSRRARILATSRKRLAPMDTVKRMWAAASSTEMPRSSMARR